MRLDVNGVLWGPIWRSFQERNLSRGVHLSGSGALTDYQCDMPTAFWSEICSHSQYGRFGRQSVGLVTEVGGRYENSDGSSDGGRSLRRGDFVCAAFVVATTPGRTIYAGPGRGRTRNLPEQLRLVSCRRSQRAGK